jgi:hypothetical protein
MQDILDWSVQHGMQQMISLIVGGVTKLWAVFLKIAVDYTTPNVTGAGFASVYNLVAGVALAMAFLGWLVSLASAWKQGRMQFAVLGGIKAAAGVTLAGVGAIFMLQLADECTTSLAQAGGSLAQQADFTTSLVKANPLVAVVVGLLIALFVIFAIIFLVVHSPLVLAWALAGSVAAAGQVHPASSGWLALWFSRLTALAWAKFMMVAVMLLSQALLLPLDAGDDPLKQVVDVIQGLVLAFLLATTPYLLWELVDFIGDRVGGAAAVGARASSVAGAGMGSVAATGRSAAGAAVGAMMSSAADLARRFTGGSTSSGDDGGDGGTPTSRPGALPRPASMPTTGQQGPVEGRGSGESTGAQPSSGSSGPAVANRGRVYSGSPIIPDLSPSGGGPAPGSAGGVGTPPPDPPN